MSLLAMCSRNAPRGSIAPLTRLLGSASPSKRATSPLRGEVIRRLRREVPLDTFLSGAITHSS
jgi:hypothetical protein